MTISQIEWKPIFFKISLDFWYVVGYKGYTCIAERLQASIVSLAVRIISDAYGRVLCAEMESHEHIGELDHFQKLHFHLHLSTGLFRVGDLQALN